MTHHGPFMHSGQTNRKIMVIVLVGLSPSLVAGVWRYGAAGAAVLGAALLGAWCCDWVFDRRNAFDGSALVTGALVALILPASMPWWLALIGGAIAVTIGKHAFGGLGRNLFNPAALARVLLMGIVPGYLFQTKWNLDGVSSATPLAKESGALMSDLGEVVLGNVPGSLGQAAPLTVLGGGMLLLILRVIDWRVPLVYLTTIAFCSLVLPASDRIAGHAPWLLGNPLLQISAGGSLLCAFFMLTDPVSAPFSPLGRTWFAVIAGVATMLIRYYTPYPDGAALGLLMANACAPMIDRLTLGLGTISPSALPRP